MILASRSFDNEILYSPPNQMDHALTYYIEQSSLNNLIEPTAKSIANDPTDVAIESISNTALEVYKQLELGEGIPRTLIFLGLSRYLFDVAYSYDKILSYDKQWSQIFQEKCEEYSKQRVRDLKLSKDVIEGYTPGLSLSSMFKGKRINSLLPLEFMTNPIDMMNYVHSVLQQLGTYFSKGKSMSFDDTFTLLMAHMSIAPPVNGAAIARFAIKWDDLQLSPIVAMSKNYFVAAIEALMGTNDWQNDI
ncbi:hypothetical protein TVAG_276900 [Trichomonas vaginalis G3]|uniref:VPS9 domain-containing protein n=1 Tax=Trichomonas vaginalis (strain ATCC PRA-98 / G3) TaxID=412133 RepID=A2FUF0_TRIV3|nr:hypothetical protein TVAGG3_0883830 [Trichomonas vaginalis G3]EAX91471.1 hypothetical protein TVAG_276900 [Trichomonas vaginalis G3]KAI5502240.1 hypothetical protein TVAGG3_0883830 [Trichomonas vaginalis G3]|eukprot:XP_001304401.1 hypothetical protein [Trichomonas vaginalis G3]